MRALAIIVWVAASTSPAIAQESGDSPDALAPPRAEAGENEGPTSSVTESAATPGASARPNRTEVRVSDISRDPHGTPQIPPGYESGIVGPYTRIVVNRPSRTAELAAAELAATRTRRRAPADRPANMITLDPFSLAFGILSLDYERAFGDYLSLYLGPKVVLFDDFLADIYALESFEQYGAGIGARIFVLGTAPRGFYVSPGVAISYITWNETVEGIAFQARILTGFNWLFGPFTLSIGGGLSINVFSGRDGTTEETITNVTPDARTAIGVAF
ncbi:MAG: hypothetical protein AAGF12_13265 [Myxococcota bacterium]